MKIEWNKVAWYSKLLAVILFIFIIWLGFYFKGQFDEVSIMMRKSPVPISVEMHKNDLYENPQTGFPIDPSGVYRSKQNKYSSIKIKSLNDGKFSVEGFTVFENGSEAPPLGELSGVMEMKNGQAVYLDEYCKVNFEFIDSQTLKVEDKSGCGGMGVDFTGIYSKDTDRISVHQFPDSYNTVTSPYPYIQRLTRSGDCANDINLAYCKEFLELKYNGQIFIENTLLGVFDSNELKKISDLAQKLKNNINQCTPLEKTTDQQVWTVDIGREQYIIDTMKCNELEQIGDLINQKVLEKSK